MKELNVQEIMSLMEALQASNLGYLKLKDKDFSLELRAQQTPAVTGGPDLLPVQAPVAAPAAQTTAPLHRGQAVVSPIVGTFYESPAPDKPPYVRVGSQVRKGDTLFIIESMKLMNEVASECDGTITEIVAENAQGVEYGQPILYIE